MRERKGLISLGIFWILLTNHFSGIQDYSQLTDLDLWLGAGEHVRPSLTLVSLPFFFIHQPFNCVM